MSIQNSNDSVNQEQKLKKKKKKKGHFVPFGETCLFSKEIK